MLRVAIAESVGWLPG